MTIVVRIGMCMLFFWLLVCNTGLAETNRATEELLSAPHQPLKRVIPPAEQVAQPEKLGETHEPAKKQNALDSQSSQSENENTPAVKSHSDKSRKADKVQKTVENGIQIKLQGCYYNQNAQSAVCTFQLTSPSDACKVAIYCYSGIQAVDSNNKTLQCNEVQMGQNRSWEYVFATLDMGAQVKVEINLQAASPVTLISNMQMVMSVNGKRKIVQLTNITVQ